MGVPDDSDYESDEDERNGSSSVIRTTIEVSSIVPQTRYYGSTTTMRPERYNQPEGYSSTHPPPMPSADLGNGVQIIYSANLQTNPPIVTVNNQLSEEEGSANQPTLGPPTVSTTMATTTTKATPAASTSTVRYPSASDIYSEPFRIGPNLPMEFQKPIDDPESELAMADDTTPHSANGQGSRYRTTTVASTTTTSLPSSLTAAFGGYQSLMSTKKPKQIQIIIPYQTYKKPEPFRPHGPEENRLDQELDYHAQEESSIVTSKHTTGTTPNGNSIDQPAKPKQRFVENDSVKYFQSTAHLRDILQKETTQPFRRQPTPSAGVVKPVKVKKVRPVEISKDSKPFTVRIPKMTPLPPIAGLSSLTSVRSGYERHTTTTPVPDESGEITRPPLVALSKYAKPKYNTLQAVNVSTTRLKISPTTYAQKSRTTISQLLRTTKILPKGPKLFRNDLLVSEEPIRTTRPPPFLPTLTSYQRRTTTVLSSGTLTSTAPTTSTTASSTTTTPSTTSERPTTVAEETTTASPIYERYELDIDPNELQRKIDTWTEEEFGSEDFARKSSTLSLHRVSKAIPWEFLTSTMLPSLRDRSTGGKHSRSGWHNVKIAISPITKEKIYVQQQQQRHSNHQLEEAADDPDVGSSGLVSPRFSIRPTPLYYKSGGVFQTGSSTVDVSPESVNELLEQKPKHRFSSSSSGGGGGSNAGPGTSASKVKHLLQQRKYVRKKPQAYPGPRPTVSSSREDV
ncbi:hypothetical protein AND_008757 [Anopheles darlingi]|uniref:Uncharacterized protein n=1 Tax=Anopheles darlingi TaxID=43151 RepID=W5JA44_ANODA|nr:hypothetical protein AND_008757 [Anopheles darlingi]